MKSLAKLPWISRCPILVSYASIQPRTYALSRRYVVMCGEKRGKVTASTRLYCTKPSQDDGDASHGMRYNCGELRGHQLGHYVTLRGHLQFQRLGKFATLRDSYGSTQVVIRDQDIPMQEMLDDTTFESYVEVMGTVQRRPTGQENKAMATGEIEILADKYRVINPACKDLPFLIREHNKPKEALRMKYRYLDLRQSQMQHNLKLKSQVAKRMRDFLQDKENFVELTTPTLSVNTPGGAQEYIVPTRHPGKFYSLVQSPQTYKQLAIIGGFDRYFQFAICYRDEGARPDRQPEFMQVDIEMSNVGMKDIQHLTEQLILHSWPSHLPPLSAPPFPTMTYTEAVGTYGVDKPDTRFGWKLMDVSDVVRGCGIKVLEAGVSQEGQSARAFCIPQGQANISKKIVSSWEELAKQQHGLPGVSVFYVQDNFSFKGIVAKKMTPSSQSELCGALGAQKGDVVVMAVGPHEKACGLLGQLRVAGADILEASGVEVRNPNTYNFLWVLDFPLFEKDPNLGCLLSCHHPFTRPREEDAHYLYTDPIKARSQHYDLVLNGCEVGGGSIRVHEAELQRHILHNILGVKDDSLGFLSEALECGAPPHGGIALGFDRFIAKLCGASSIRDVIAFPKSVEGRCLMSGAPGDITEEEKKLYHIRVVEKTPCTTE